jgi:hypothetical protein
MHVPEKMAETPSSIAAQLLEVDIRDFSET